MPAAARGFGGLVFASPGGCLAGDARAATLLLDNDMEAVIVVGDFVCPESVALVRELTSSGLRVYYVTGRHDDAHIVRLLDAAGAVRLDGGLAEAAGYLVAGIGGREPHTNMESLRKALEGSKAERARLVLASYHAPHGVVDLTRLGVRGGLYELLPFSSMARVHFFSRCSDPGAIALGPWGGVAACLPRLTETPCALTLRDGGVSRLCLS